MLLAGTILAACGTSSTTKTIIIKTTTVTTSPTSTTSTTTSHTVEPTAVVCAPYTTSDSRRFSGQDWTFTNRISEIDAREISCPAARQLIDRADLYLSLAGPAPGDYISVPPWKCQASRPYDAPHWTWVSDCKRGDRYRLSWSERQLRASKVGCPGGFEVGGRPGGFFAHIRERATDCSVASLVTQKYATRFANLLGRQNYPTLDIEGFQCVTTQYRQEIRITCSAPDGRQVTFFGAP